MGKSMKPILASSYVSDTNNPIKTSWDLTSDNGKVNYKMIDLNSTYRSLQQLESLNNQMMFDEDTKKRVREILDKKINELDKKYTII